MTVLATLLVAVTLNATDRLIYESIAEPQVTGVPPSYALRNLMWTQDGALRCYGDDFIGGEVRRAYVESRDLGLTWKTFVAEKDDPVAMVKRPLSGDWFALLEEEWGGPYSVARSKTGPSDVAAVRTPAKFTDFNFFRHPQYLPVSGDETAI